MYEDSLLACLEAAKAKQWYIDNAVLLIFGAFFLCIALFVILATPKDGGDDTTR